MHRRHLTVATTKCNTAFIRNEQDRQIIRDLFLSFAQTSSPDASEPFLLVDDLRELLLSIGDRPSDETLAKLVEAVDVDRSGTIEYDEFINGCEQIFSGTTSSTSTDADADDSSPLDIDSLVTTFRTLDRDGSGDLSLDELSGLLSTAGSTLSELDVTDIMNAADENDDGVISLDEFIGFMTDPTKVNLSWRIRSSFRVALVMGGPGSGKGTLCERLVKQARVTHFSSGDMLRNEIESGSPLAQSITRTMNEGRLVSSTTIIALLKKQLRRFPGALVALDGFPRNLENYVDFDKVCGRPEFAIKIDVPDETMVERILKRAETSGRADDNEETAKKRLSTYHEQTEPTIKQLELDGVPIYQLDGMKSPDEVWADLVEKCPLIGTRV